MEAVVLVWFVMVAAVPVLVLAWAGMELAEVIAQTKTNKKQKNIENQLFN